MQVALLAVEYYGNLYVASIAVCITAESEDPLKVWDVQKWLTLAVE